jgi:hypothetical protein
MPPDIDPRRFDPLSVLRPCIAVRPSGRRQEFARVRCHLEQNGGGGNCEAAGRTGHRSSPIGAADGAKAHRIRSSILPKNDPLARDESASARI